jgi:tRNA dimethylallyltransferase
MQRAPPTLDIEIVAVDAFTIYRGMDVGTAKPTRRGPRGRPHHMVDVLDPTRT